MDGNEAPVLVPPRPPRRGPRGHLVKCAACGHEWRTTGKKFAKCPACNPDNGEALKRARAAKQQQSEPRPPAAAPVKVVSADPPAPKPAPAKDPAPPPSNPPAPTGSPAGDTEPADLIRRFLRRGAS